MIIKHIIFNRKKDDTKANRAFHISAVNFALATLEQIDKEMAANATNAGKLRELSEEQQETQQKLDEKMDRWVYLNDLAEQIEAQKE